MQPSRFVVLRLGCCCKIFIKEHFVNEGNREKKNLCTIDDAQYMEKHS